MTGSADSLPPPLPPTDVPSRGPWWREMVAWVVIVVAVVIAMLRVSLDKSEAPSEEKIKQESALQADTYARFTVGLHSLFGAAASSPEWQMPAPDGKSLLDELRMAVVKGEVEGGDKAREIFRAVRARHGQALNDTESRLLSRLETIYGEATLMEGTADSAEAPEEAETGEGDFLRDQLGWCGKLAEVYGKPETDPVRREMFREAIRTCVAWMAGSVGIVVLLLLGALLCSLAVALFVRGSFRWKFASQLPRLSASHIVWMEAFAIYLAAAVIGGWAADALAQAVNTMTQGATAQWGLDMVLTLLAMVAGVVIGLWWPWRCGVRGSLYRLGWGVHQGSGWAREVVAGVLGYLAGLPIIAIGVAITLVLVTLSGADASHPINDMAQAPTVVITLIGIMAVVWAPLTEELFFRGALYSGARLRVGRWLGGLGTGVLFAAVHPQGWAAIPGLAAIGLVLALLREWRSSLIASITAHALNNGSLLVMMLLLQR